MTHVCSIYVKHQMYLTGFSLQLPYLGFIGYDKNVSFVCFLNILLTTKSQ